MANKENFIMIPESIASRNDLNLGAKILYGFINSYSRKRDKCWAGNPYMAEYFSTDKRTVSRWLKELNDKNLIVINKKYEHGRVKSRNIIVLKNEVSTNNSNSSNIKNDTNTNRQINRNGAEAKKHRIAADNVKQGTSYVRRQIENDNIPPNEANKYFRSE